ncbi:MAG: hypothetical protein ANABAC_1742 [Anaerolineae bacterium]|nr:MAG: hypothetical protein ANABAC_1742 [Anaerolineae bacterium]
MSSATCCAPTANHTHPKQQPASACLAGYAPAEEGNAILSPLCYNGIVF